MTQLVTSRNESDRQSNVTPQLAHNVTSPALWWVGWGALFILRAALLVSLVERGGLVSWVLVWVEGLSLTLGTLNAVQAEQKDTSAVGFFAPFAYALGVIVLPRASHPSLLSQVVYWEALALSTWALLHLGQRFTFGAASWIKLCDTGPYAMMRHPQLTARLLIIGAVCSQARHLVEVLGCVVASGLTFGVMAVEERSLRQFPEWREYAERVRSRFLPGWF